jgi:Ca2+-binding EF-hand superfamily protein
MQAPGGLLAVSTAATRETQRAQVRKLMEAIDMDCDGVVTVEELRTWVRNQARQKEVQSTPKPVSSFLLF